jgi:hypothetical protein
MKQVQTYKITKGDVVSTNGDYVEQHSMEQTPYTFSPGGIYNQPVEVTRDRADVIPLVCNHFVYSQEEEDRVRTNLEKDGYTVSKDFSDFSGCDYLRGVKHIAIFGLTPEIKEALFGGYKSEVAHLRYELNSKWKEVQNLHYKLSLTEDSLQILDKKITEYNNLPWWKKLWRKV